MTRGLCPRQCMSPQVFIVPPPSFLISGEVAFRPAVSVVPLWARRGSLLHSVRVSPGHFPGCSSTMSQILARSRRPLQTRCLPGSGLSAKGPWLRCHLMANSVSEKPALEKHLKGVLGDETLRGCESPRMRLCYRFTVFVKED